MDSSKPAEANGAEPRGGGRRDMWIGISVLGGCFLVALAISWKSAELSRPVFSQEPEPPTTEGIAGFPAEVRPLDLLAAAQGKTSRDVLIGIVAEGVERDGTLALGDERFVRYSFRSLPGQGPAPRRADGTLAARVYCGQQSVLLNAQGLGAGKDKPRKRCDDAVQRLPPPGCTLEQIWKAAEARGVGANAVARIEYYRAQAGPAWRFSVGGQAPFSLAEDCTTELDGEDAKGRVP